MGDKKKILYVHHDSGNSGSSRSLSFLLDKLDLNKYSPIIHCIFKGPVIELFKNKGIKVIEGKGILPFHGSTVTGMSLALFIKNWISLPRSLFFAYRLIKRAKPDIIHLNSSCLFIVAVAAKLYSKKIIVISHIREPLLQSSVSGSIMKYMNFKFVDYFIAIDNFSANSMKTKNNINVIHNAVNFEQYNPSIKSKALRKELNLSENDILFLYLARISKSNGAKELIEVASQLVEKNSHFHFILTGLNKDSHDKYSTDILSLVKKQNNIHLLPFRVDVPELIADSDIMVVPFVTPHFARSIVEASAMGKPTIGSNVGGVNELIINNKTGYLYNTNQEFYSYCKMLGNDREQRFMLGKNALEFAKKNFNNTISSSKVFAIYEYLQKRKEEVELNKKINILGPKFDSGL